MSGFIQSLNFFFTGNYNADDGDNNIVAIGFGGTVRAYGGNDSVDTVSFYTKVEDTWGHLDLWGLAGGIEVQKSDWGNINAHALAINSYINHWGQTGDVNFYGAVLNSNIYRNGYSGSVNFYGAAGSSYIEQNTQYGDTTVAGLFGSSVIRRNGQSGKINFYGGALNSTIIDNLVQGDVDVFGAVAHSYIERNGNNGSLRLFGLTGFSEIFLNTNSGDVTVGAIGASNVISRKGKTGNVTAIGAGGVNVITMNVEQGDLTVGLLAGANVITRSGQGHSNITVAGLANIITTGDSDDTVLSMGGASVVKAGYKGNDNITVGGGVNVVMVGHGNNTIKALGGANVVLSGHGNNDIWVAGGANVVMNGNGRLTAQAIGGLNVVLTGDGKANIEVDGGLNIVMAGNGSLFSGNVSSNKLGNYASTDYNQQAQTAEPGQVAIVKIPPNWGLPIQSGHGGSNDAFLMVDGALDASKLVIKQSVQLNQGHTYEFTTYVATNDSNLRLQLNVNGKDVGSPMLAKYTIADGGWQKITMSFVAEVSGVATVGLCSLNTTWSANDFALDDISLKDVSLWSNGDFSNQVQSVKFFMDGIWIRGEREAQSTFEPSKGYPQTFTVYFFDGVYTKAIEVKATVQGDGQVSFNRVANSAKYWAADVTSSLSKDTLPSGGTCTNNEDSYILSKTVSQFVALPTDYNQQAQTAEPGQVAIVKTPPNWGLPIQSGHGGSNDAFLMVDGALDASKLVIKQSVQLNQGHTYEFTTYVATNDSNLRLQLNVNGKDVGSPMLAKYTTADGGWQKITMSFVAEVSGVATVGLRSLNTTWSANDFALDDISLRDVSLWSNGNFSMTEVAGNTIRAYGLGNLVMSGDGDNRIRAGGVLGMVTDTIGLSAADSFDFDRIVVLGNDVGDTTIKTMANLVSLAALTLTNLGNIVIAGEGNNKVKTYGGFNFVQTGSGNDEVSMVGATNCAVVGNGNKEVARLV